MELTWSECMCLHGLDAVRNRFSNSLSKLIIIGSGFDPRMTVGVSALLQAAPHCRGLLVNYSEKQSVHNPAYTEERNRNVEKLKEICGNYLFEVNVEVWSRDIGATIVQKSMRSVISSTLISDYDEIVVDISAMPRIVSFNLIKRLLDLKKFPANRSKKMSILVCENSSLDDGIKSIIGTGSPEFLQGLNSFVMDMEGTRANTRVWFPILGLNEETTLQKIAKFLSPDETCPVLPFPSANVRREEEIVRRHGIELFTALEVEKRNIIYVPENQPIVMYQKLCNTVSFYESALNPFPGDSEISYIFSSQGSKIMDIGVLMAIIDLLQNELTVGMAILENEGYDKSQAGYQPENNELCCVCLDDNEYAW